jgi:AcrR family transcriptional regulator
MSATAINLARVTSATVVSYDRSMGRWEPNARGRLLEAAFALYGERGFEQTTVAEIAERAGLTERTFFRHFADKREVLFAGADALRKLMISTVAQAPGSLAPIAAAAAGLEAAGALIQEGGELPRQRQAIIDASSELQERELVKLAMLASALTDALRLRGVEDRVASLAAEAAIAVFKIAFVRWINANDQRDLPRGIRESFDELKTLTSAGAPAN